MLKDDLLKSNRIKITALREEDIDTVTKWYEDTKFLRVFDFNPASPLCREKIKEWLLGEVNNPNNYFFVVRENSDGPMLGYVEIERISWNNGVGGIAIGIGDLKQCGKGYGTEALNLVMDFAFRELNLHRLQLITISYNERAINLYEKLGFKREGVYREAVFRDGKRYDMYLYGILDREWSQIKSINNK
ncbi:RimJ/RimL family protein N-acetyltransferase [Clostridium tetanomorphum]|uniref:GNAT family N-acetyltransferase n=1 Tax=Clostridium tetanomorphum TaxID=1553 RepID=A0A923EBC1_CLOTT|nr:GNAT family protein [Clostridium tetanomorphum]KAJ49882.1 acetyltransferase [Clostridium tetanomorphum DSM 665]MBC2398131.1 GNAT family N-acetyltransferase [Clostridium tetanomorphum]MBP1866502.1 RimJ/RimL family protein N-acetyltransferase [Clostridium tetanomorphum]NRS84171.1 RimJ/RimL family protein N-acetyltransferase [Clostridium tetanomorphum]NRZ97383.1 RimJ/RimL family protein N-acetyltransferase [Clostridium tetanomorphum]